MALPVDDAAPAPAFTWGAGGGRLTADQIAARRKVTEALAQQGMDSSPLPVGTRGAGVWTQGLARVSKGLLSGLMERRDDDAAQANAADNRQMIEKMVALYGGGAQPSAAQNVATQGTVPAATSATSPFIPSTEPAPGAPLPKVNPEMHAAALAAGVNDPNPAYSQPSPMDPPSGQDRINMVATALGEERPGSPESLGAINTIRTRAIDGGYGGTTPTAVVLAPKQYSSMNDPANRAALLSRATASSPEVTKVSDAIDQAYGVGKYVNAGPNDPTEGKTHFYDPASMVPVNSVPSWAQGKEYQQIGNTRFLDDPDEPAAKPVQVASAAPQGPTPGVAAAQDGGALPANAAPTQGYAVPGQPTPDVAKVSGALSGVNPAVLQAYTSPYSDPQTKALAGQILAQQMKQKAAAPYKDADGNLLQVGPDGLLHAVIKAESSTPDVKNYEYALTHPDFAQKQNANKVLGKDGEIYHIGPDGKPVIDHKNTPAEGAPMSEDAVDFAAERAIAGDPKALTNLGRGAQGRADLVKINERIATKMKNDPNGARTILDNVAQQAERVSSSRALGTKETHFGVAEKAMEESLPLAQSASNAVPRSEWFHLNKLIQAGQTEHSDPSVKRFLIATDTAAKDYARTINPTGALRESDIEYARKILSTADGPEAYTAGLDQLRMEAGVMHRAIQRQKDELHGKKPAETPAAATSTGAPAPGAYVWTPENGLAPK